MKINLLGGSYEQKYKELNAQRSINWYPVVTDQQEQNKSQVALYPTPGLTSYVALPGRYIRGIFTARTHTGVRCFAVCDTTLYEILNNKSYISRGSLSPLTAGQSKIYMDCTENNELFIGGWEASFVFNLGTNTLTQVTDNQFPGEITTVTALDLYVVVTSAGAAFESLTTSALHWLSTQSYSTTYRAAPIIAVKAFREEIFNFTSESIEQYYNDGTSPYSRMPRTTLSVGLAARDSLAVWKDGFLFLGRSQEDGEYAIYFFDGWYNCQLISPPSITWQLNTTKEPLDAANGFVQTTKDGHVLYYLNIPGLPTTYVYDFTTKFWFERQSTQPVLNSDGTRPQGQFRGKYHTCFNGKHLFTDSWSSTIFIEDYNNQTEDGVYIRRERTSQTFEQENQLISVSSLEIECNTGYANSTTPNPVLQVSYSIDGGYTFRQVRNFLLGKQGQHTWRCKKSKLGTGRKWVIKMVLTDPIDLMLTDAIAHGEVSVY